jgi:class 3 adenylate cyclase
MREILFLVFFFFYLTVYGVELQDSLLVDWKDPSQAVELRLKSMGEVCDQVLLRSNPDSAYMLAHEMHNLAEISGNIIYQAEALRIQGESFHFRGDIPQALAYLEECLSISSKADYLKGMATSYNSIGNILVEQGKYAEALDHYNKSLELNKQISDKSAMGNTMIAMGIMYYDMGNAPKSLALFDEALLLNQETGDIRGMGRINNNIGVIYHEQGNFELAQEYFENALTLFEQAGEKRGMASCLNNIGDLFTSQAKYEEAIPYNLRSLEMRETLGDKRGMANCYNVIGDNLALQKRYLKALEYYLKSVKIREELGEKRALSRVYGNIGHLYLIQKNYTEGMGWCTKAYELSQDIGAKIEQKEACECLYKINKETGKPVIALAYHERLIELEYGLKSDETAKTLQEHEFKKIILEDSLHKEQEKISMELEHREEVSRKNRQRNISLFTGLAVLLLAGGLYSRLRYIRKSRTEIQKEKDRSDELLLNILPSETADELKLNGAVKARNFELVTVMFTDFKGFTYMAEKLSAQELVSEIDYCFKAFDQIIFEHNIEKIKTIGDAYMCAGGLPLANKTNPLDVVKAALEIQEFMIRLKHEKEAQSLPYFEVRIGIHTGPVVAGVVGTRKFQYDIWGDTVNIAARMESSGEVGKVNISQTTFELIKTQFECTYRGKIDAKNKGAIDMYFVDV